MHNFINVEIRTTFNASVILYKPSSFQKNQNIYTIPPDLIIKLQASLINTHTLIELSSFKTPDFYARTLAPINQPSDQSDHLEKR